MISKIFDYGIALIILGVLFQLFSGFLIPL